MNHKELIEAIDEEWTRIFGTSYEADHGHLLADLFPENIQPFDELPESYTVEGNLNSLWRERFGHTYIECVELSELDGELGDEHWTHIQSVIAEGG
jgi:hypothetical protein